VDWQYESSVGSELPILSMLRDLVQTGDEVQLLKGCLSGTMAYVFNKMSEKIPFSEAVRQAVDLDFTELDVREDLSGLDVSRKIVILARDLGMDVSVEDVEVESLISDVIRNK
jgi:aspartokinase/homoserine dehydrogenase 1